MRQFTIILLSMIAGIQCSMASLTEGTWAGSLRFNANKETLNNFLIEKGESENEYILTGFFDRWFYSGSNSLEAASINPIKGVFNEEEGTFLIPPAQILFDYEDDTSVLHVSLIQATINQSGKFDLHPEEPIIFTLQNGALTCKGTNAFYLGEMKEGSDYAMGFGYAQDVTLGTVNGEMSFESYETTGWVSSTVSASMVFGTANTVTIDNICGLGFGRPIEFSLKDDLTIEAEEIVYGTLVAGGQQIEVYPCSCDKYGDPLRENGKYLLKGNLAETNIPDNYDLSFGLWGIFDADGKAYYHFRNTEGNFTDKRPNTMVGPVIRSSANVEEWYTLDGYRIIPEDAPHGIYIVKTSNKTIKIIK